MTRHHALAVLGIVLVVGLLAAAVYVCVDQAIAAVEYGGLTR